MGLRLEKSFYIVLENLSLVSGPCEPNHIPWNMYKVFATVNDLHIKQSNEL